MMNARVLVLVSICALVPATALPQALTSLASVRVGYSTRKNTVRPQGDLKAQIVSELLLHKARQSLPVAHTRRLGAERLEVVADQLVQRSLLGPTGLIG